MKKISTRQLIIFYFIFSFAIKFLLLPQFLAGTAGKDLWISAIIGVAKELVVLWVVLVVMAMDKDRDVYAGLRLGKNGIGSAVFAKGVLTIMFAFFLLQAMITLVQTEYLLSHTLYESLNIHKFVIPMLVLGIFFCYSKTRAVFRSGEIFYILILVAIFLAVLPALWKVDVREVLPIVPSSFGPIWRAVYHNLIYFEGAVILLMFKGEIDIKKGFVRNFMIWAGIGAVVFVAFIFFYYSLFGPLANLRTLGVVDVTGQNSYIAQNGRLEWIIASVWLLLLLVRFGVLFYACFATARYVTHIKFQPAAIVFPLAVVMYFMFVFVKDWSPVIEWSRPFTAALFVGVPLLFLILVLCTRRKKAVRDV
jgi:hypothetical protein